jgi:Tfp pilus assembly protein PilN
MIEINLLPEEKRVKMRKAAAAVPDKPVVPVSESLKKLVFIVPLIVGVLVVVHVYLLISYFATGATLGSLNRKMQSFQPQLQNLAGFKVKFESLSQDGKILQELASNSVVWSKILNRLSLDLPSGIWLTDLSANSGQLTMKCSVVSVAGDPVELINQFITRLKEDTDFYGIFSNFDLGSVQKRMVGSFEVTDFAVTMEVKAR